MVHTDFILSNINIRVMLIFFCVDIFLFVIFIVGLLRLCSSHGHFSVTLISGVSFVDDSREQYNEPTSGMSWMGF